MLIDDGFDDPDTIAYLNIFGDVMGVLPKMLFAKLFQKLLPYSHSARVAQETKIST